MSYTKEITIWCDEPGCLEWVQFNTSESNGGLVSPARAVANRRGWFSTRQRDLCPLHKSSVAPA